MNLDGQELVLRLIVLAIQPIVLLWKITSF